MTHQAHNDGRTQVFDLQANSEALTSEVTALNARVATVQAADRRREQERLQAAQEAESLEGLLQETRDKARATEASQAEARKAAEAAATSARAELELAAAAAEAARSESAQVRIHCKPLFD